MYRLRCSVRAPRHRARWARKILPKALGYDLRHVPRHELLPAAGLLPAVPDAAEAGGGRVDSAAAAEWRGETCVTSSSRRVSLRSCFHVYTCLHRLHVTGIALCRLRQQLKVRMYMHYYLPMTRYLGDRHMSHQVQHLRQMT